MAKQSLKQTIMELLNRFGVQVDEHTVEKVIRDEGDTRKVKKKSNEKTFSFAEFFQHARIRDLEKE